VSDSFRDFRIPNFDSTDPNLKPMMQDAFNAGVEYQLKANATLTVNYTHSSLRRTIEDMGVLVNGSEEYKYVNPGEGIAKTMNPSGLTPVFDTPKPNRTYDALEVSLEKRFSNNWFASASYVYSRLYGNYAGLANSDEISTPTTNRSSATTSSRRAPSRARQQRQPRVGPLPAGVGQPRQPGRSWPPGDGSSKRREAVRLLHAALRHAGGCVLLRRQRHAGQSDGVQHQQHPAARGRPRQPGPHADALADRPPAGARHQDGRQQADAVRSEHPEPVQPEDVAPHLRQPEPPAADSSEINLANTNLANGHDTTR
jgi:hypothetical protein